MKKFIISTKRLLLRPFSQEDAQFLYNLNEKEEVLKYTGDVAFKNIEEASSFVKNYKHYEEHGFGRWTVIRKEDKKAIGWCGLKNNEENLIDLGFRFLLEEWGKGYATEAAKACITYGFTELKMAQIVGRVLPDNIGSVKVLEKIGMNFWKKGECDGFGNALYYRIQK